MLYNTKALIEPFVCKMMSHKFSWKNLKNGFVALAPMAGITDSPFRQICKSNGADVVFTEFVHVRPVASGNEKTLKLLRYTESERPIVAQIFGKEPEYFAKAAKVIEKLGFDGIDINMGCPARKVKEHGSGSALINNPDLAVEIVSAVRLATSLPLSVKTRVGFNKIDGPEFAQKLVDAGAELLTIHGRTVSQGFGGFADFNSIKTIVENVNVPVIGNGDVVDYPSYCEMMETGCSGVMVGRGALGNPWLFKSIKQKKDCKPSFEEIKTEIIKHAEIIEVMNLDFIQFRKHLAWYVKGLPNSRELRANLVQVNSFSDIMQIINTIQY